MSNGANKPHMELYKVVETATRIVGDIQKQLDTDQERMGYVGRRADRRLANPRRLAKIWSEGQLEEAEKTFDLAREGKLDTETGVQAKKRRGRKRQDDPLQAARDNLFLLWDSIRSDSGFKNAAKQVKKSISSAQSESRQLERNSKRLEMMLNKTIAAVRDMKQAMSAGIRQVPYEPMLEAGPEVGFEKKVAVLQRISHDALARALPGTAPTPAPSPNPRGGGASDQGGRES